jgi:parvulin-like peptidyl-prolyl isomerase
MQQNYGTVNGEKITIADIKMVLRNNEIDFNSLPKDTQEKVINQVVDTKLLAQNALKEGIDKTPEFKIALNKIKKDIALEFWMQKQSREIKVSQKELKEFFNKNKDKFTQKAVLKARHILVKTKKEAQDIIETLKKAKDLKAKFISLAKTKSTGPSGKNGGDLGWFEPAQMVPAFSKATSALKKGTITLTPVKTQFGFHIIYLEDKKAEGTTTFENAKNKIRQVVVQEKFLTKIRATVKKLTKKAKIKLNK